MIVEKLRGAIYKEEHLSSLILEKIKEDIYSTLKCKKIFKNILGRVGKLFFYKKIDHKCIL